MKFQLEKNGEVNIFFNYLLPFHLALSTFLFNFFLLLVEFLVFTFGFETIIPTFVFVLVPQLNRFRGSQCLLAAVCLFMSQLTEICPMSVSSRKSSWCSFPGTYTKTKELLETVFPECLWLSKTTYCLWSEWQFEIYIFFWENFHVLRQYLSNVITEKSGLIWSVYKWSWFLPSNLQHIIAQRIFILKSLDFKLYIYCDCSKSRFLWDMVCNFNL